MLWENNWAEVLQKDSLSQSWYVLHIVNFIFLRKFYLVLLLVLNLCLVLVLKFSEEELVDETRITKTHLWIPIVSMATVVVVSLVIGLAFKVYRG